MNSQAATRRKALSEIIVMTLLILSYMWVWQGSFSGSAVVFFGMFVALGVASHLRRGESARQIGFGLAHARTAANLAVRYILPLALLFVVMGTFMQTLDFPELSRWPIKLAGSTVWGTAQQYGLLAFFYRSFRELFDGMAAPIVAASGLFGLFHLPNPFLTAVTLVAGSLACWMYRRAPNLWVLGVTHAVTSFCIARSLPDEITAGMRVGPGFLRLMDRIEAGTIETLIRWPW